MNVSSLQETLVDVECVYVCVHLDNNCLTQIRQLFKQLKAFSLPFHVTSTFKCSLNHFIFNCFLQIKQISNFFMQKKMRIWIYHHIITIRDRHCT